MRKPNAVTVFGGNPPLLLLASDVQDHLLTVRRFFDAAPGRRLHGAERDRLGVSALGRRGRRLLVSAVATVPAPPPAYRAIPSQFPPMRPV